MSGHVELMLAVFFSFVLPPITSILQLHILMFHNFEVFKHITTEKKIKLYFGEVFKE